MVNDEVPALLLKGSLKMRHLLNSQSNNRHGVRVIGLFFSREMINASRKEVPHLLKQDTLPSPIKIPRSKERV